MNVAIDTNVLVYAEGLNGDSKRESALQLLQQLSPESTLIPVQALAELFNVLVNKGRRPRQKAAEAVLSWGDVFSSIESSGEVMLAAIDLANAHQLGIWDAMIMASAADARCRMLLSEDLQDGFTWGGVTVTNPFSSPPHPLLSPLLQNGERPRRAQRG